LEAEPALGIVGPLVAHRGDPEVIFYAGGYVDPRNWDLEFRATPRRLSDWEGQPPRQVDFLGTAGTLVRASAARSAGPAPEHFYYGLDDIDFTLHLAGLGWKLECLPAAVAWQDVGDTVGGTPFHPYLAVRNRLGLVARNASRPMLARELLRVVSWLIRDAFRPRSGSRGDLGPRLKGLIDFCRGRWGPPPAAF
jgi:GT2 family glycosyltransferase